MKTLSVTEVARNFRKVIDAVEHEQEENPKDFRDIPRLKMVAMRLPD